MVVSGALMCGCFGCFSLVFRCFLSVLGRVTIDVCFILFHHNWPSEQSFNIKHDLNDFFPGTQNLNI